MRFVCLLCALFVLSINGFSQKRYANHRSRGHGSSAQPARKAFGPFRYRTLKESIGELYLMMHQPKDTQLVVGSHLMVKERGGYFTRVEHPDDADLVLRLDSVNQDRGMFTSTKKRSYFIYFDGYPKYFLNAVPKQDLDLAKVMFENKPLWLKSDLIMKYDDKGDVNDTIRTERFDKVTVLKVTPGTDNDKPIRFILKTKNNEIGFVDVGMSGTNMADPDHYCYFKNYFYPTDPKVGHNFSPEVWANMKAGKITPGMSAEQVLIIWGDPDKIERTNNRSGKREVWHYTGMWYQNLDFENSVLKEMN